MTFPVSTTISPKYLDASLSGPYSSVFRETLDQFYQYTD